jgi:hypothetical protein
MKYIPHIGGIIISYNNEVNIHITKLSCSTNTKHIPYDDGRKRQHPRGLNK